MKYLIIAGLTAAGLFVSTFTAQAAAPGYIYLQVESKGEAWYVSPLDDQRYYLGRPEDAYEIMKRLSLGVTHETITSTDSFPTRLRGLILLDTESRGEAYYIYPKDGRKHFLGRPEDAFKIMRERGEGISDANMNAIPEGNVETAIPASGIRNNVPYTSQAPRGRWSDPRQADGCEESSALMAIAWARGETLTPEKAERDIIGMSIHQQAAYGEYRDSSAGDTLHYLIKDYLKYPDAELKGNMTVASMIDTLRAGKIMIAPINGLAVDVPYYRQPGPPHHMIVIVGYDPVKKVFIAHDPAARANYEFPAATLQAALRDYPTGYREPIKQVEKTVIVVSK